MKENLRIDFDVWLRVREPQDDRMHAVIESEYVEETRTSIGEEDGQPVICVNSYQVSKYARLAQLVER